MSDRTRRLLTEVGRFLAVGGAATLVALFLFNLLAHGYDTHPALLRDRPITAYLVANTVGMAISYHGSRNWAFRDRPPRTADGGLAAYVVINVVTMTIPVACLAISRHALGLADPLSDNVSANLIGLVLGLMARFYLFRRFVFHRPISIVEIYDEPTPLAPGPISEPVIEPVVESPTARSTTVPARPPAA